MILFIIFIGFLVFVAAVLQHREEELQDSFTSSVIETSDELVEEVANLNAELELRGSERRQLSEEGVENLRKNLTNSRKRCNLYKTELNRVKALAGD